MGLDLSQEEYERLAELLKIRLTPYIPHVPHPTQHAFLWLSCQEALYGGAAGGGKSDALLMAALQYVDVPGYNAILFRKTYADLKLPGSLIPRSHEWLDNTDAKWNENDSRWTFPSGATVSFGYMRNDEDRHRYQSAEFQFCVARGTGVLMADGSLKAIETIRPGDRVQTLVGPRPVRAVHSFGKKPTVGVRTPLGVNYVSTSHALLTPQGWASPSELISTLYRAGGSTSEELGPKPLTSGQCIVSLPPDALPSYGLAPQRGAGTVLVGTAGEEASGGIDSSVLRRTPLASPPPAWQFVPLMLYSPALQSGHASCEYDYGGEGERPYCPPPSYSGDYPLGPGFCGEQPHHLAGSGEERTQPPVGVEQPFGTTLRPWGGLELAPTHSHCPALRPYHPYTKEDLGLEEADLPSVCSVRMGLADVVQEVWDLSVCEASHYIIANGAIAKNCSFDELTHFSKLQYTYMFSRVRKPADLTKRNPLSQVPLRTRSATNPGGRGHLWVRKRFVDPVGSREDEPDDPTQRVFIPARLDDNPSVDKESYLLGLSQLDEGEQQQLLHGDWDAREPGPWVIPDRTWVDAAVALGQELWDAGAIERDFSRPICFGIDWGEYTQAYILVPMPMGGVYVMPSEVVGEHEDAATVSLRILRRAENMGMSKIDVARYDAAGIQNMRVFAKTARARPGWERLKTQKIAFGKYKRETMTYMRLLFRRTAAQRQHRIIAIHPDNQRLIQQLRAWRRKDDESEDIEKFDDHGPDALVAGIAPTAKAHRAYVEDLLEKARQKKKKEAR